MQQGQLLLLPAGVWGVAQYRSWHLRHVRIDTTATDWVVHVVEKSHLGPSSACLVTRLGREVPTGICHMCCVAALDAAAATVVPTADAVQLNQHCCSPSCFVLA